MPFVRVIFKSATVALLQKCGSSTRRRGGAECAGFSKAQPLRFCHFSSLNPLLDSKQRMCCGTLIGRRRAGGKSKSAAIALLRNRTDRRPLAGGAKDVIGGSPDQKRNGCAFGSGAKAQRLRFWIRRQKRNGCVFGSGKKRPPCKRVAGRLNFKNATVALLVSTCSVIRAGSNTQTRCWSCSYTGLPFWLCPCTGQPRLWRQQQPATRTAR